MSRLDICYFQPDEKEIKTADVADGIYEPCPGEYIKGQSKDF